MQGRDWHSVSEPVLEPAFVFRRPCSHNTKPPPTSTRSARTTDPGRTKPPNRNRLPGGICISAAIDGIEKNTSVGARGLSVQVTDVRTLAGVFVGAA